MDNNNKDKFMLETAIRFSEFSKDPNTKVGAVAVDDNYRVLSIGYNGLPSKYPDDYSLLSREDKNLITIHAEVNCILNAAKNGVSLQGATMYVSEQCCSNCAAAMINAGIKRVVMPTSTNLNPNWQRSLELSAEVFQQCNIQVDKTKIRTYL